MSYEIPNFYVGVLPADVDMSTEASFQFAAVKAAAAASVTGIGVGGAAIVLPTASLPILGVLQNNPQQGEAGQVMVQGVTKALMGGTVAIGNLLMVNASGQFVVAATGADAVAMALESAVVGDIAAVLLKSFGKR